MAALAALPVMMECGSFSDADVLHRLDGPQASAVQQLLTHPSLASPLLKFLPIRVQLELALRTSKLLLLTFGTEDGTSKVWRLLCENLCNESRLWLPSSDQELVLLAGGRGGWRALFRELWPLRGCFHRRGAEVDSEGGQQRTEEEKFCLETYCRFRAAPLEPTGAVHGKSIELPLHQRVALLRRSQPDLSRGEAVKRVLAATRAGKMEAASVAESGIDPSSEGPQADGFMASVLSVQAGPGGSVLTVSPGIGLRSFEFGHVFDGNTCQREVYDNCGLRLVRDLLNGVNGALVLYGQTGSGKTYTMFGPESAVGESRGLASRVAFAVLEAMDARKAVGFEVRLGFSYVEVFGNKIIDLLAEADGFGLNGPINQRLGTRLVLEGGLEVPIEAEGDLLAALERGDTRKRCACTAMNERSTRAHTLLVFHLQQADPASGNPPVSSRLFLADLGGSERVTKSHANEDAKTAGTVSWQEYYHSRRRLQETCNINEGLLSLKRCIRTLGERQQRLAANKKTGPVPFRDSKLTEVLAPALGGLARTAIVVCCSPDNCHAEETVQSLRFGEMCSRIEHVQKVTADPSSAVAKALVQIDEEIAEVEKMVRDKERWEWRERVRTDVVDASNAATSKMNADEEMELGGYGAVEILPDTGDNVRNENVTHTVMGQVLVGAEEERVRLETLLERRRKLLGEA